MEDHFWINPLRLERNEVDGRESEDSESRRCRSVERSPSQETVLRAASINAFIRSAEVAKDQIEALKTHMIDDHYSHLDPDSLSSHQYEFLKFPEEVMEDRDTRLAELLQHFQKFAVAFFQVLQETEAMEEETEYHGMLQSSRDKMIRLLSDIQLAIEVLGLTSFEDVPYEMLPSHMKDVGKLSKKSLRDYLVIRDYANFLDFVLDQKEKFLELIT